MWWHFICVYLHIQYERPLRIASMNLKWDSSGFNRETVFCARNKNLTDKYISPDIADSLYKNRILFLLADKSRRSYLRNHDKIDRYVQSENRIYFLGLNFLNQPDFKSGTKIWFLSNYELNELNNVNELNIINHKK